MSILKTSWSFITWNTLLFILHCFLYYNSWLLKLLVFGCYQALSYFWSVWCWGDLCIGSQYVKFHLGHLYCMWREWFQEKYHYLFNNIFWWSHYFGEAFSFKKKFNKVQKSLICCYTFFSNFSKMLFYALSSLGLLKKV